MARLEPIYSVGKSLRKNSLSGKLSQRDTNKRLCKEHISKLAMVTQLAVVLRLDSFVDGLLSLSTEVQYVRRCVDAIQ